MFVRLTVCHLFVLIINMLKLKTIINLLVSLGFLLDLGQSANMLGHACYLDWRMTKSGCCVLFISTTNVLIQLHLSCFGISFTRSQDVLTSSNWCLLWKYSNGQTGWSPPHRLHSRVDCRRPLSKPCWRQTFRPNERGEIWSRCARLLLMSPAE